MYKIFTIALGGAIGAVARYIIGGLTYRFSKGVFPIGTLVINTTGSLVIGFLWGLLDRFTIPSSIRLFIFIGILGGYTTFSTFSLETFNLIRDGEYRIALVNVFLSVFLSIVAVFLGFFISKTLMNISK